MNKLSKEELKKRDKMIIDFIIKETSPGHPIGAQKIIDKLELNNTRFVVQDAVRRNHKLYPGIMVAHGKGYWYDEKAVDLKNSEGYNDPTFKFAVEGLSKTMMENGIKEPGKSEIVRRDKVIFEPGRFITVNDKKYWTVEGINTFLILSVAGNEIECVPVGHCIAHKGVKEADGILVSEVHKALTGTVKKFNTKEVQLFNAILDGCGIVRASSNCLERICNKLPGAFREEGKVYIVPPKKEEKTVATVSKEQPKPCTYGRKEEKTVATASKEQPKPCTYGKKVYHEEDLELALVKQRADIYERILFAMIGGAK